MTKEEILKKISELQSEVDKNDNAVQEYYSKAISFRDKNNYLKEQVKELKKEIKTTFQEEKKGLWQPEYGDLYYFVDIDRMLVDYTDWYDTHSDQCRYDHKVIFKSKTQVQEYLDYLIAKEKAINEFSDEEWKDEDISKYCFFYDSRSREFFSYSASICREYVPYFKTKEACQEFIDKYEWQIKREMGVE